MSSPIAKTLKSTAAIASATLFIQVGSAAAASPRLDFQQQVRRVLAGTAARPFIARTDSSPPDRLERDADAQAFVQELLSGVGLPRPGVADGRKRQQPAGAVEITRDGSPGDTEQASVRRLLLGRHAPMHAAP